MLSNPTAGWLHRATPLNSQSKSFLSPLARQIKPWYPIHRRLERGSFGKWTPCATMTDESAHEAGSNSGSAGPPLSPWALSIPSSPTLAVKALADDRLAQGLTVYRTGVGELNPTIRLPEVAVQEFVRAATEGDTGYTPAHGDPRACAAIAADLRLNFGLDYPADCILISSGPKDSLFKALMAVLPGREADEVAVFAPIFEAFESVPRMVTGKPPVVLPTTADFLPDPAVLGALLARRGASIGALILCSPNNPAGVVYPPEVLQELADVLKQYPHVVVVSDETYRTVLYDGLPHHSIASHLPEQTIVIAGASKEVAGTGLRVGFMAGPAAAVAVAAEIQGSCSGTVNLPAQLAYSRALACDADMRIRGAIRTTLEAKRDAFVKALREACPRARLPTPQGAFYVFPDMSAYLSDPSIAMDSDVELAQHILKESGVVCIPGSAFMCEGHLRLAFGLATGDELEEAAAAMGRVMSSLPRRGN